jgi:hypothetical protein
MTHPNDALFAGQRSLLDLTAEAQDRGTTDRNIRSSGIDESEDLQPVFGRKDGSNMSIIAEAVELRRPVEERGSLDEASTGRYAVGKDGKLYTDTGGIGNADNVVHHGMGDFGGMLGGIEVYFMRIDNTPTGNALKDAGFVGRPHEVQAGKKSRGTFKAKDVAKVFKKKGAKLVKFDESNESIEEGQRDAISSMEKKIKEMRNTPIGNASTPGGRFHFGVKVLKQDIRDFEKVLKLAKAGKWTEASKVGRGLDTAIRDELPDAMWDILDALRESIDEGKNLSTGQLKRLAAEYLRNEDSNDHAGNILLLAKAFGTPKDVKVASALIRERGSQ